MKLQTNVIISNEFKKCIQSGNYEKIVLNIMNSSIKLFPNKYIHISKQSNGECDFVDSITSEKYDAKLPINKQQGELIGSNNSNFEKWLMSMQEEAGEFAQYINNRGRDFDIKTLKLYQIMADRISAVNQNENIIFLFPYPIVYEQEPFIFGQFASDILSAIFKELKENNIVRERKIYAIYPAMTENVVVRSLNTGIREFITNNELKNYIDYETRIIP